MTDSTQGAGWQARGSRRIVEARDLPVVVVVRKDLRALHDIFEGRRLAVARSIYLAFVERIDAGDGECTRKDLAGDAGVTPKTLDEYVPDFIAAGIVEREHRFEDGVNLPNVWRLLSLPEEGARSVPTHGDDPQQSSSSAASEEKKGIGGGLTTLPGVTLGAGEPPEINGVPVTADLLSDAAELLRRKTKVDGQRVTPEEMAKAVVAIAEINRQADSDFGVGAHLRAIVMRVRERPSYTADAHSRLVMSAWRRRWWERGGRGGRATPAVVYGNSGVFEQVVQDAMDEKRGRTQEPVVPGPDSPSRYDRQD